jgi:nucleoside-diphosphate-sugar epimerase
MSVLITGCNGYIGSIMTQHFLEEGFEVVGVDLPSSLKAAASYIGHPDFSFEPVDVRFMEDMEPLIKKATAVIPLAAVVGYQACGKDPTGAAEVNQASIENIVKILRPHQIILYPNTNSGYGVKQKKDFYTEHDPLDPNTEYGKTKVAGENAVLSHQQGYSFRLASVFGVSPKMRWDLMVHDFVKRLMDQPGAAGRLDLYEPEAMRNFVHVRDVARAFVWAFSQGRPGIYNLGLPSISKADLVQAVVAKSGKSSVFIDTTNNEDPDKRDYLVSGDKLKYAGFQLRHQLRPGIKEVVDFYRATELSHEEVLPVR